MQTTNVSDFFLPLELILDIFINLLNNLEIDLF